MPGFIRRYGFFPGTEVITQIEGVVIIDLPPPGAVSGVDTGVTAVVGEFADVTFATAADGSGNVTTLVQPQEIFSSQDLLNKVGGFDETIGEYGFTEGSGFVALRNKRYSRLIVAPVNLASAKGSRYIRKLPFCASQTDPTPAVPMAGGTIVAGREFRGPLGGRSRIAQRVNFTGKAPITTGTNGLAWSNVFTSQLFSTGQYFEQIWQVKAVGPVFTNVPPNGAIGMPAVSAVGDYIAWGLSTKFNAISLLSFFSSVGVGGVVAWEYWNGAAWVAIPGVVDGSTNLTGSALQQTVTFTPPADWATTALNAVTKFYVRARTTTVYTTLPTYAGTMANGIDLSQVLRPDGTLGVYPGDVLVIGYNSAGTALPAALAGTYRVNTQANPQDRAFMLEQLDGSALPAVPAGGSTNIPWRLHIGSDADSAPVIVFGASTPGGYGIGGAGGYVVPTRPLTNEASALTDGTWTAGGILTPVVVPPAVTGSTWDPLSGLEGVVHPAGMPYVSAVQKPNAPSSASNDALYTTSFAALVSEQAPISDISIMFAARTSTNIRASLNTTSNTASATAAGRMAVLRPDLHVQSTSAAVADPDPGVGANRSERVIYTWPGSRTFIPEAVNFRLSVADGSVTADGVLDVGADGWLASVLSNLPPERNPGQGADPVPTILSPVLGLQRGIPPLAMPDYIVLRARGVCSLRLDRVIGPVFQSGTTTSLISGQKNISRRRMADFIQDSLARRLVQFSKLPLTNQNKDNATAEVDAFLSTLLSVDNAAAQRIKDYQVDDKSGNTPATDAQGIFVIIIRVVLIATGDFIVLQSEIGENVKILQAA